MTLTNRGTSLSTTLGTSLLLTLGLSLVATGCDQKGGVFEEPEPELLVDRTTPRVANLNPSDLMTDQQKKALASGPGEIQYTAPFDGEPVVTKKDPDGLIIEDFVVGKGSAAEGDKILKIHYQGYLTNGFMFDDSHPRGKALDVKLNQPNMIPGFSRGVVGLKKGGRRRIEIPGALAYGSTGRGPIPPDATLVFLIDVEDVIDPPPPPKGPEAFAGAPLSTEQADGGVTIEIHGKGAGARVAKTGDVVGVHYTGTLQDGTQFDSSLTRGQPINFPLGSGRVIKGWDVGVAGMKVGELRKLQIPADMAYGKNARGKIPANADLVFTIELMSISDAPKAPARPKRPQRPQPKRPQPKRPQPKR